MANLPTISVVLRPFIDQHKMQAISLRITHQRKSIFKTIGIKVNANDFREKASAFKFVMPSDRRHADKNAIIKFEYELLETAFYKLAAKGNLSIDQVKLVIANKATTGMSFWACGDEYISKSISNAGSSRRWTYCLELINNYAPGLNLQAIDKLWLLNFEDFLKLKYANANSRLAPLKFLRAVFNFAIERGAEIEYPFGNGKYKLPTEEKRLRNYLTTKQLTEIESFVDTALNPSIKRAGKWFLFQCYSGLRYSDIEQWTPDHVRDNRIYFADVKTDTPHFIPIYTRLQIAIDEVAELKPMQYENYKRNLNTIGVALNLPFILNSHIARHTFAVQYLERGGSVFVLQSLLGHSDIKTTMIYAKVTNRGIEDDMKRVVG
jgi:integrase/recombinase XerD